MRPSLRNLQATARAIPRAKSTSFIGLGRMGYQMAYNLFSKQYLQANGSEPPSFVVCDAVPDSARAFCLEFSQQYPDAQISIASTPEECVRAHFQSVARRLRWALYDIDPHYFPVALLQCYRPLHKFRVSTQDQLYQLFKDFTRVRVHQQTLHCALIPRLSTWMSPVKLRRTLLGQVHR
jgi:hypothetical protein